MSSAWGLSWGNAWALAWNLLSPTPTPDGGGAGGPRYSDIKAYRKHLLTLSRAAESRFKDVKEALVNDDKEAPVEVRKIVAAAKKLAIEEVKPDNEYEIQRAILGFISNAIVKLDFLLASAIEKRQAEEAEEELIVLMALV